LELLPQGSLSQWASDGKQTVDENSWSTFGIFLPLVARHWKCELAQTFLRRADPEQGNEGAADIGQIAPIGWECWMKRDTLGFQLSVIWLVVLAGGLAFLWLA
jgi:hypothetical protein